MRGEAEVRSDVLRPQAATAVPRQAPVATRGRKRLQLHRPEVSVWGGRKRFGEAKSHLTKRDKAVPGEKFVALCAKQQLTAPNTTAGVLTSREIERSATPLTSSITPAASRLLKDGTGSEQPGTIAV